MDSNKDEALRCVRIAEEAIAAGNKGRAMKFIKIAQRLNQNLQVSELLAACEVIDSGSSGSGTGVNGAGETKNAAASASACKEKLEHSSNVERSYTEEHAQLIRQVKKNKDYYAILGVEKTCSGEEIRKAYRKLSLKVHPDKNKAPGSEEAFKTVSKAFKCLSDENSRRQYDQVGLADEFEYNQQHDVRRRRRRRNGNDFFDDEFDPDEIFRAFFGQSEMFRTSQVYRSRATGGHQRAEVQGGGPNIMLLIQILPFLVILLLAYLPFSEPEYSLSKNYNYQIPKTTERYGVEFFVKSPTFDESYPLGSSARTKIEDSVIKDYKNVLVHYCRVELQRRHWSKNLPTPHCDKLNALEVA